MNEGRENIPTKSACEKSRKQLNILEILAVTIQFN